MDWIFQKLMYLYTDPTGLWLNFRITCVLIYAGLAAKLIARIIRLHVRKHQR